MNAHSRSNALMAVQRARDAGYHHTAQALLKVVNDDRLNQQILHDLEVFFASPDHLREARKLGLCPLDYMAYRSDQDRLAREDALRTTHEEADTRQFKEVMRAHYHDEPDPTE